MGLASAWSGLIMQPAGSDPSFTVVEDDTLAPVAATASAHASSDVMCASQVPEVRMEEELTWVVDVHNSFVSFKLILQGIPRGL